MRVLTLNTWGAPYARQRKARFLAMSEQFKALSPDIILLQEVYLPTSKRLLLEQLSTHYPYHHDFASSLLGSGLLTLSRYPIVDAAFHRFRLGGKAERLQHGDFYVGKGIGLVRLQTPDGLLDVYNAHTHAQYDSSPDNEYAAFNETNLYEAARFVWAQSGDNPVLLCGDLNTQPHQPGYSIITQLGRLHDAYLTVHGRSDVTFSPENPYMDALHGECLDYVLLRKLTARSIEIALTDALSGEALAYSDHYALLAEIDMTPAPAPAEHNANLGRIMEKLLQRVTIAAAEAESRQFGRWERAALGVSSLLDGNLAINFFAPRHSGLRRFLRRLLLVGALSFAAYHALHGALTLQARRNAIAALEQELRVQVAAKRLFDGRTWD